MTSTGQAKCHTEVGQKEYLMPTKGSNKGFTGKGTFEFGFEAGPQLPLVEGSAKAKPLKQGNALPIPSTVWLSMYCLSLPLTVARTEASFKC